MLKIKRDFDWLELFHQKRKQVISFPRTLMSHHHAFRPQVLVDRTFVTPPPLIIFLFSDDHIFCLQNNKPRCVLISIYQTNPEINGALKSEFAACT